jgi:hypothetical protein
MNMQTVSLSSLEPSRSNPRKAIDRGSLEGLAASIRNDGLLQNLVISPARGDRPCSPPLADQTRRAFEAIGSLLEQSKEPRCKSYVKKFRCVRPTKAT